LRKPHGARNPYYRWLGLVEYIGEIVRLAQRPDSPFDVSFYQENQRKMMRDADNFQIRRHLSVSSWSEIFRQFPRLLPEDLLPTNRITYGVWPWQTR
jgi:hypothetical protein